MTRTSSWVALRNPISGKLWVATVVSGICVSAHDTAAIWVMNSLSHSTMLLSLMSTAATLPFFLFILPAGALADMMDRKKMLYVAYIWLAVCAGGLAILGWLNLLTPYLILGSIFLIETGFAFNAPVFSAVVPEIVSNEELPFGVNLERTTTEHLRDYRSSSGRTTFGFRRSQHRFRAQRPLFACGAGKYCTVETQDLETSARA